MFIGFSIEQTILGEFKITVPDIQYAVFYIPYFHNLKQTVKSKLENHVQDLFRHYKDSPVIHVTSVQKLSLTNPDIIWAGVDIDIKNTNFKVQTEMF